MKMTMIILLKRSFCLLLLLTIFTGALQAQDPIFSQFYSSPLSVNPALAGNGSADWRLIINRRSQWFASGVDPFNTTSVSFDGKLFKQKDKETNYIGGGLMFMQDYGMSGAYKNNSFHGILSSHVAIDENDYHGLSIGLAATYTNLIIDYTQLSFSSQLASSGFNRALPTNEAYLSTVKPYVSMAAGITYTYTDESSNFDVGVAGYRFMKTRRSALNDSTQLDPPHYNFHADYQAFLSDRLAFNANAVYIVQNSQNFYSLGVNLGHILDDSETPTVFNTGLWYRSNDAVIPYLGLMYRSLQLGLTYDVTHSSSKNSLGSMKTFEFSLILRSPQKVAHAIPCPWK